MTDLRIIFPKPGFFIVDVRMQLLFNGWVVYDGSFKSGIDLTLAVGPGNHQLESRIHLAAVVRKQRWNLAVADTPAFATLEYSRLWGNFKKRVGVSETRPLPAAAMVSRGERGRFRAGGRWWRGFRG